MTAFTHTLFRAVGTACITGRIFLSHGDGVHSIPIGAGITRGTADGTDHGMDTIGIIIRYGADLIIRADRPAVTIVPCRVRV